jgi:hypothetical protein
LVACFAVQACADPPIKNVIEKSDQERICDVHYVAELVEQYFAKQMHYPYGQGFMSHAEGTVDIPSAVILHRGPIPNEFKREGRSNSRYSLEDFEALLQSVLGPVTIPTDNRDILEGTRIFPDKNIPAFYQYRFDGEAYYVSAILRTERPDTYYLAPGFHKYQVSNNAYPTNKISRYKDVKKNCTRLTNN